MVRCGVLLRRGDCLSTAPWRLKRAIGLLQRCSSSKKQPISQLTNVFGTDQIGIDAHRSRGAGVDRGAERQLDCRSIRNLPKRNSLKRIRQKEFAKKKSVTSVGRRSVVRVGRSPRLLPARAGRSRACEGPMSTYSALIVKQNTDLRLYLQ